MKEQQISKEVSMSDSEAVDQNASDLAREGGLNFGYDFWQSPPPDPAAINAECWAAAEQAAWQVVNYMHPTLGSEKKRKEVVDYVRRLFKHGLHCKVFPYGSVPLKTYLPDGDIDLTIITSPNIKGSLAHEILAVLKGEEQNENAEYEVKDTLLIDAEVKIVKCLVGGMVIDISFNQLGGLLALCFLEQVDCLVGKNHLFKRSIILVKAWCYYESRILGAHYGLISTYALETLVLYIFHLFHSSLHSPLEVLYRFLKYFSQFDWETYCVSLQGPVYISSLPDIVVEMPENGLKNLMLSEEFLNNCKELFSVSSRCLETKQKAFPRKHLNIIDPLKENNNLGRSVNKGNFYRIRSAFKYGAQKLGQVLLQPRDKVADEVSGFFRNTLARHGHLALTLSGIKVLEASSSLNANSVENLYRALREMGLTGIGGEPEALNLLVDLTGDYDIHIRCLQYALLCQELALSTPALSDPPPPPSWIQNVNPWDTVSGSMPHGQNQFLHVNLNPAMKDPPMHPAADSGLPASSTPALSVLPQSPSWIQNKKPQNTISRSLPQDTALFVPPTLPSQIQNKKPQDTALSVPPPPPSQIQNKKPQDTALSVPPPIPSRNQNKKPQDTVSRSMPQGKNKFSRVNLNPEFVEPSFHPAADSALPASAFGSEGMIQSAQRNTCFPNMSRKNELAPTSCRSNSSTNGNREFRHAQSRIRGRRSDARSQSPCSIKNDNHANDSSSPSYRIEFGTVGNLAENLIFDSSLSWGFSQEAQDSKAVPRKES